MSVVSEYWGKPVCVSVCIDLSNIERMSAIIKQWIRFENCREGRREIVYQKWTICSWNEGHSVHCCKAGLHTYTIQVKAICAGWPGRLAIHWKGYVIGLPVILSIVSIMLVSLSLCHHHVPRIWIVNTIHIKRAIHSQGHNDLQSPLHVIN